MRNQNILMLLFSCITTCTVQAQCYTPEHLARLRDEVIVENCSPIGYYSMIVTVLSNRWFINVRDPQVIADLLEGYEATRALPYPKRTHEEHRWLKVLLTPIQHYFFEEYYRQLQVKQLQEERRADQILFSPQGTASTQKKTGKQHLLPAVSQHIIDSTLDMMIYEHYGAHKHLTSLIALAYSRRKELQLYDPEQLARIAITYNKLKGHPDRWRKEWDALYELLDPGQRAVFYRIVKDMERKTREKEQARQLEKALER